MYGSLWTLLHHYDLLQLWTGNWITLGQWITWYFSGWILNRFQRFLTQNLGSNIFHICAI
jgi:hypothetical protein